MAKRNILTKEQPGLYKKSRQVTEFNPRLHQLLDRCFQFTEQSVVCLDLTVDFTAVRDNTLFLQCTGNHALVNGRLLG